MSSRNISLFKNISRLALFNASYRLKLTRVPYLPLVLNVEPTNLCNLRCPMCPVSQQRFNSSVERGLMDIALLESLIPQIKTFAPSVAINLGGESTLHPQLPEMVRLLRGAGCYVFLDTNSNRLTHEMAKALILNGLSEIVFCLDGDGTAESYESVRVGGRFQLAVESITEFLKLRQALGSRSPKTVIKNIQFFTQGKTPRFPCALKELFKELGPDIYRSTWADYWPGSHRELLHYAYEIEPYDEAYSACTNLWKKLAISWDGRVYICCLDLNRTTPVGDIRNDTIAQIWNGKCMQEFRQMHARNLQSKISLCKSCTMIRRGPAGAIAGLNAARYERFTRFFDES